MKRCPWAESAAALDQAYHDEEWGVPHHGEATLFEMLTLEGAQAGLSWSTILARRAGYRKAFLGFDVDRIAAFGEPEIDALVLDPGIVRHRAKIAATVGNAQAAVALRDTDGGLDAFLWSFVDGEPLQPAFVDRVPATTELAATLSKALRRRGMRFVGPTICYAFMQACGMTNDHITTCYRFGALSAPG